MKKCTKCHKSKSKDQFNWRNKSQRTRQSSCKECTRKAIREHYSNNKQYYIKKAKPIKQKIVQRNKSIVREVLESGCVDCGESDMRTLHFDHVRGEKVANISYFVNGGLSSENLQKEVAKCEIRCANCHLKKTFDQCGWSK